MKKWAMPHKDKAKLFEKTAWGLKRGGREEKDPEKTYPRLRRTNARD